MTKLVALKSFPIFHNGEATTLEVLQPLPEGFRADLIPGLIAEGFLGDPDALTAGAVIEQIGDPSATLVSGSLSSAAIYASEVVAAAAEGATASTTDEGATASVTAEAAGTITAATATTTAAEATATAADAESTVTAASEPQPLAGALEAHKKADLLAHLIALDPAGDFDGTMTKPEIIAAIRAKEAA